jgi:hypothetical protein
VDHKEAGETKLIAQEVELFQPSPEEVELAKQEAAREPVVRRLVLHVEPGCPDTFLDDLREVVKTFPGEHELCLRVGERNLRLGEGFRVSADAACRAELDSLPGAGRLVA